MLKKWIFFIVTFLFFITSPIFSNGIEARCSDTRPGSAPILLSAIPGETSVTLVWQEAADPISYYLLVYGRSETSFEYGAANIGGKGTISYTVNNLQNGVKYYFKVRAGNGCKPGEFSNKLSAVPGEKIKEESVNVVLPTLSIIRTDLEASISPVFGVARENKKNQSIVGSVNEPINETCESCNTPIYLTGEVLLLLLYFFISYKSKSSTLKPIYSIIFPVFIYLMFIFANVGCTGEQFLCRYFIFVNLFIYILLIVIYRQLKIASHDPR